MVDGKEWFGGNYLKICMCFVLPELVLMKTSNFLFLFSKEPQSEYSEPRVSPYRLAAHLTSAFAIYSGLLWTGLSVVMPEPPAESLAWVQGAAKVKRLALPVSIIVGITAVSGAFVAGNDAVCLHSLPCL